MRSSMLFWNQQISQRATVPSWYFWVFLTLPAFKNSFQGALPPMVGQSFFLASSSPPNVDGLASAAILANCWVGNDCGNLPISSSHSASTVCFIILSAPRGISCARDGGCMGDAGACTHCSACTTALVHSTFILPFSPFFSITLFLAIMEFRQEESTNRKVV